MARYPEPGKVKTRLAARVGAAAACRLYGAFLADIGRRLGGAQWECVWAVTPPGRRLDAAIVGPGRQIAQRGSDLAARMHACFVDLFAGGARRVVMIGADAPQIEPATVASAFGALAAGADVVLVPSRDGGYCLVGLGAPLDIFGGVDMGTERVLAQTRARCGELGLVLREMAEQFDVDELGDVESLVEAIDAGADLRDTAAVLSAWRRDGLLP